MIKEEIATFYGIKIFVNRNDTAGNIILRGGNPEQVEIDTILRNIKEDSVIVDVGACYGEYTLILANKCKNGLIIAVEPNPYHFELLKKGVEINGFKNIILINKALSDKEGIADFYMGDKHLEGSTLFKDKMIKELGHGISFEKISIDVTTLDKLCDELGINKIDILKLDAEGAEFRILKGAERIFKNLLK